MLSSVPICMLISITILMCFGISFPIYAKSYKDNESNKAQLAAGVILGIMAIGLAYSKIRHEDVAFDFRTVMLCLCGLFFGTIPTAITTAMVTIVVVIQGIGEMPPEQVAAECIYTVAAGATGIILYTHDKRNNEKSLLSIVLVSVITHVIMALSIYATTNCNTDYSAVLILLPIVSITTGYIINTQVQYNDIQRQYHQLEDKYYKLMLCDDDIFWELDTAGKITYVSSNVIQALGYERDEIIGRKPHFLIEDAESIRLLTNYGKQIDHPGKEYFRNELVLKHKNGNKVYCDTRCTSIIDKVVQKLAGYVCVTRNITNAHIHSELSRHHQKFIREQTTRLAQQQELISQYKQDLIQAHKDIDEAKQSSSQEMSKQMTILANVCNEIVASIDNIQKSAQILRDQDQPQPIREQLLDQTLYASDLLKTLSNDLIESDLFAKEVAKLNISICNIEDVLIEMCNYHNSHNSSLLKKPIVFQHEINLKNDEKIIKADIQHIKRVVNILMTYSYKYTTAGQITVACSLQSDTELLISITDTSLGIPEDELPNFFKPFHEAIDPHKSPKNMFRQSWLGLYSAKSLVELMNGQIWVISAIGKGTTVNFTVPFAKAGEMVVQHADTQYKWQDYSALVAMSARDISIATCETLAKTHIKIHCIHIGADNIDSPPPESRYHSRYDVIVTDNDAAKTQYTQDVIKKHNAAIVVTIDSETTVSQLCKQIDKRLTQKHEN